MTIYQTPNCIEDSVVKCSNYTFQDDNLNEFDSSSEETDDEEF